MIDKWSGENGFKETTEDAIDELMEKDEEYRQDLDEVQETADVDFEKIKQKMDDVRIQSLEPYIQSNKDLLTEYKNQVNYIVGTLIPKLKALQAEYKALIDEIRTANELQGKENSEHADAIEESGESKVENILNTNPLEDEDTGNDISGAEAVPEEPVSAQGDGKVNKGDMVTLIGNLARQSNHAPTLTPISQYQGAQLYVQGIAAGTRSPYHLGTSPNMKDGKGT